MEYFSVHGEMCQTFKGWRQTTLTNTSKIIANPRICMKDLKRVHADISFVPPLYSVSLSACEICIEIEIKTCLYEYTRKTLHLNWNTITRYMYVLHCSILAKDPVCRLLRSTSVTCVYYPNANVCYYGDSKNKKDLERVMALLLFIFLSRGMPIYGTWVPSFKFLYLQQSLTYVAHWLKNCINSSIIIVVLIKLDWLDSLTVEIFEK